MRSRRLKSALLIVVLLVMINLPLVHSVWTSWQVERNGVDVTATLVGHQVLGSADDPAYWLTYRLPEDLDARQASARVTREAYDAAVAADAVQVRVLPDRTVAATVEGEVHSSLGWILTLTVDALLLTLVLWVARTGRYRRGGVRRIEAVSDVGVTAEPVGIDEDEAGIVTIRGELVTGDEHEVELDVAGERVIVVLDGHAVSAPVPGPARVRGRWLT